MSVVTQYLEIGTDKYGEWDFSVTAGRLDGLSVDDARKFRDTALLAVIEAHNWWFRCHMQKDQPTRAALTPEDRR